MPILILEMKKTFRSSLKPGFRRVFGFPNIKVTRFLLPLILSQINWQLRALRFASPNASFTKNADCHEANTRVIISGGDALWSPAIRLLSFWWTMRWEYTFFAEPSLVRCIMQPLVTLTWAKSVSRSTSIVLRICCWAGISHGAAEMRLLPQDFSRW